MTLIKCINNSQIKFFKMAPTVTNLIFQKIMKVASLNMMECSKKFLEAKM